MKGFGDITGTVAIEMQNNSYVHALDTGLFTVGAPHKGTDLSGFSLYFSIIFFTLLQRSP